MLALLLALLLALAWRPALARPPAACPALTGPPTAAQMAQVQREARDRGFLWRISRDGHSSWLFGTMHLGRLAWMAPGPRLAEALRDSDVLALEIDFADPAVQAEMTRPEAMGPHLGLPDDVAARLARQREAACLAAQAVAGMHPLMQAMTLLALDATRDGLQPGYGQEAMLSAQARALDLPVVSLETMAVQMQALIPREPEQAVAMVESVLDRLERGQGRQELRRLARAWELGRLAELEQYERWCQCLVTEADRELMRRVLDDRNPGMAARIDAMHRSGRRVLAAVGALHMVGPTGLPRLLMQRGYTVQRIAFAPM